MKKILLVSFTLFFYAHLFAQENMRNETSDFVSSVLFIHELNPSEKEESEIINKMFKLSLEQYLKKQEDSKRLIDTALQVLYRNGGSDYSDSPDERRMKSRRALCFASIALASKPDMRLTFTKYSQFALMEGKSNTELLEERFLGLLFLEVLIKYDEKALTKNDLLLVQKYIDLQGENLSLLIKEKSNKLLKDYTSSF